MAELIDKDMLVEALAISRHHHASSSRENELLYRAENIVREQPTVTEAEIRAKAIDEFFEELQKYEDDDMWLRLKMSSIYEIAEQLKGGAV